MWYSFSVTLSPPVNLSHISSSKEHHNCVITERKDTVFRSLLLVYISPITGVTSCYKYLLNQESGSRNRNIIINTPAQLLKPSWASSIPPRSYRHNVRVLKIFPFCLISELFNSCIHSVRDQHHRRRSVPQTMNLRHFHSLPNLTAYYPKPVLELPTWLAICSFESDSPQ